MSTAETWTLLSCDEKRWRHSARDANAKSCTYTGLSMTQMQKCPLSLAYHLLRTYQKRSFASIWPHISATPWLGSLGTPAHNALECQVAG